MSTIKWLSAISSLEGRDQVPVWSEAQGDTRKFSLTTLVAYLSTAFTSLSVSSYVKVATVTVANLPSAATAGAGARATVSDATATTFNSVVAGSGANTVPVFSDGAAWRIG
jgi:hypothetical protein